jgi:hypothetical protein
MSTQSPARSFLPILHKIEATIGALFAFLVGFVLLVLGGDIIYVAWGTSDIVWLLPTWLIAVALEGTFLWKLKTSLEIGNYPFAPWFAEKSKPWPILLRPIPVTWWASHFLLGIFASMFLENLLVAGAIDWNVRILRCLIFLILDCTIAYSANLYALLAIAATGGPPRLIHQIWRWRILLDLAIAALAVCYPFITRQK